MAVFVKQNNGHDPDNGIWGDCHRAAIASILELPLSSVPHFGEGGAEGVEFDRRVKEFLFGQGLAQAHAVYGGGERLDDVLNAVGSLNPNVYYLLGGQSRNGTDHTVVCLNNRIVHDPSRVDSGIVGPCEDGWYWITFLVPIVCTNDAYRNSVIRGMCGDETIPEGESSG